MNRTRATDVATNGSVIALLWLFYSAVRSVTHGAEQVAHENAELVRAFQERLGLAIEPALQQLFLTELVGSFANVYYLLHFPLTVGLLIITFLTSRRHLFPILRDSLVIMTLVGLVVHVIFPLAPPRKLTGIVDAPALYGPNPYDLPGGDAANQLAAMPSMHVAWAIALGWALFHVRGKRHLWIVAVAHPLITLFVVLVTGHHFLADVIAGSLVAIAAIGLVWLVHGRPAALARDRQRETGKLESLHTLSTS